MPQQSTTNSGQHLVLPVGIGLLVGTFQFNTDAEIIAVGATEKTGLPSMPGPFAEIDKLQQLAAAPDQHMGGHPDIANFLKKGVLLPVQTVGKKALYTITLAALVGLALKPAQDSKDLPQKNGTPSFIYYLGGLLLIAVIFFAGGPDTTKLDSSDNIKKASARELCRTLTYSPSSWQAWYHLGNTSIISGMPGSYEFGERCITQAVTYDPLNYRLLKQLCLVRMHHGDIDGAKEAYKKLNALRSWVKIHELE